MEAQSSELIHSQRSPERPIRLLLDGRKLGDGGIGVYTENLIEGLLEVGGVDITVLYGNQRGTSAPYADRVSWMWDAAPSYSIDEVVWMPSRIDFSKFDLFHTPHYVLPYRIPIPTIVTVHDVIHITHPEKFYYPFVARMLIRSAVNRADTVLAVSRHTRTSVLELTGAPAAKVKYIPNAISTKLLQSSPETNLDGGTQPYLFALFSNTKPHKGLLDLLAAYQTFREELTWKAYSALCPKLVLAGYGIEQLLGSSEGKALLEGVEGVQIAGALSDYELRTSLKGALALVVPSLVEGFCLPALEAQALGTPVICRPVPALKELVTERDVVAESFSVSSLSAALGLGVKSRLEQPREVLHAHLDLYSCARVAATVKSEYERVLVSRRPV